MGLKANKKLFFAIRSHCQIIIRKHAFVDYPERGFSERELVSLIRRGNGPLEENNSSVAITGSYLFFPKDDLGCECKLVILIEAIEMDETATEEDYVIVCSAYREKMK